MPEPASRISFQDAAPEGRPVKDRVSERQTVTRPEGFSFLVGMGARSPQPRWVKGGSIEKLIAGLRDNARFATIVLLLLLSPLAFSYLPSFWRYVIAEPSKPTPEQARRFLKLNGYDFDEKSFLVAAGAV
jgi:hypothetical protein